MPIPQEIFDMIDIVRKPSQVISGDFDIKILVENSSNRKGYLFLLCDGFRVFLSIAIGGPVA